MSQLPTDIGGASSTRGPRLRPFTRWLLILFVAIIMPLAVSYGKRKVTLTVINGTELYIHVLVNSDSYLYVAPGDSISHVAESDQTEGIEYFDIRAFYSPGQELSGQFSTFRQVEVTYPYDPDGSIDCSDSGDDETLTESVEQLILPEDLQPFPDTLGKEVGR